MISFLCFSLRCGFNYNGIIIIIIKKQKIKNGPETDHREDEPTPIVETQGDS